MRKLKALFLIFGIIFSLYAVAQSVTIMGSAPSYNGRKIAAYSYKDLITYTPVKIGTCQVNDSAKFSIQLPNIKTSQYVYLAIDNQQGSVYVEPGRTYHVVFPPPDSTHYVNPYTTHIVDLTFLIVDTDDINSLVIDFNAQFDKFWDKDYAFFVAKEGPPHLDSFYVAMQHRYANINNDYFKAYVKYTIAGIDINILIGEKTLGDKYIKGQPVLFHNYEYMHFFNDYFSGYLERFALTPQGNDVGRFVEGANYQELLSLLKTIPLLKDNDSLSNLVLVQGLYELYYSGESSKENIKTLLTFIGTQCKIEDIRITANDMVNSFSEVVGGVTSPDFALKDSKGNINSILDFRGKYLYLCFYKSNSEESLNELTVLASLYKKYGKKMNFVCISEDKSTSDMEQFLNQNKTFTWTFLYDEGGKVREKYEVKSIPAFFLISPQGRFYLSPADSPSHGIELTFDKLLERKKPSNQ